MARKKLSKKERDFKRKYKEIEDEEFYKGVKNIGKSFVVGATALGAGAATGHPEFAILALPAMGGMVYHTLSTASSSKKAEDFKRKWKREQERLKKKRLRSVA